VRRFQLADYFAYSLRLDSDHLQIVILRRCLQTLQVNFVLPVRLSAVGDYFSI
jgi:hypothetical protein